MWGSRGDVLVRAEYDLHTCLQMDCRFAVRGGENDSMGVRAGVFITVGFGRRRMNLRPCRCQLVTRICDVGGHRLHRIAARKCRCYVSVDLRIERVVTRTGACQGSRLLQKDKLLRSIAVMS